MGSETVVHGLNTYISNNNPMAIIVIIPDSFGWRFTNTRRIADEICDKTGATVLVPDFMNGFVPHSLIISAAQYAVRMSQ